MPKTQWVTYSKDYIANPGSIGVAKGNWLKVRQFHFQYRKVVG